MITQALCLLCASVVSADWQAMEAEYHAVRERLEAAGIPAHYEVPSESGVLVFDPRPELGVGMHQVDQSSLDIARKADIRFVRFTLYWNHIEDSEDPGAHNPSALAEADRAFHLFSEHDMIPVVVVHGNPPGVSFANRREAYRRFARFMAFAAGRWPGVRYWELWNEMDVAFTDLFGASVEPEVPMAERGRMYAEMLREAYPAIKGANPEAVVVTGGMTDHTEFPTGIYQAGGGAFFDIMNLHTYGIPVQWSFVLRGAALRDLMTQHGDARKPLWNTEFGVDAGSMVRAWGVPEENAPEIWDNQQRDMLAECIQFAIKSGLYQKFFIYQFQAGNEAEGDRIAEAGVAFPEGRTVHDYGFGLMRADGRTPRPAWEWIAAEAVTAHGRIAVPLNVKTGARHGDILVFSDYPARIPRHD
jgi:hypothetical protein